MKLSYFHNNGESRVKTKPDSFPVVISPLVSLNNVINVTINITEKMNTMKIWSRVSNCRGTRNYETQNEEEAKS